MRMLWMMLFALIALILTACGPSPQEDFAQRVGQAMKSPTSDASVATPLANMRRVALAAPDTVDAPSITPDQLFDWAEATYPQFFPTKEKTLTWSVYQFRYYKDTDVYLAVESGQKVVALGKPTGGKVMPLGSLSSFRQVVSPDFWEVTRIVSLSHLLLAQGDFSHLDGHYRIRAAGDLNGDGFDDLVLGPIGFSEFKFLNSDKYYAFPFHKLLIAFFNPRLGSYEFDPTLQSTLPAMQWAHKAWISDFNKDGYNDVFVIGTGPDQGPPCGEAAVLLLGSEKGLRDQSDTLPRLAGYAHAGVVADFNNDGKDDFLYFNQPWVPRTSTDSSFADCSYRRFPGTWEWPFMLSSGNTWVQTRFELVDEKNNDMTNRNFCCLSVLAAAAGDINGDGNADLILYPTQFSNDRSGYIFTFFGDGRGKFLLQEKVAAAPYGVNTTVTNAMNLLDLDGDGLPELLINFSKQLAGLGAWKDSEIFVYKRYPEKGWIDITKLYFPTGNLNPSADAEHVFCDTMYAADLNNDGFRDLLCSSAAQIKTDERSLQSTRLWLMSQSRKLEPTGYTGFSLVDGFLTPTPVNFQGKTKIATIRNQGPADPPRWSFTTPYPHWIQLWVID